MAELTRNPRARHEPAVRPVHQSLQQGAHLCAEYPQQNVQMVCLFLQAYRPQGKQQ